MNRKTKKMLEREIFPASSLSSFNTVDLQLTVKNETFAKVFVSLKEKMKKVSK